MSFETFKKKVQNSYKNFHNFLSEKTPTRNKSIKRLKITLILFKVGKGKRRGEKDLRMSKVNRINRLTTHFVVNIAVTKLLEIRKIAN